MLQPAKARRLDRDVGARGGQVEPQFHHLGFVGLAESHTLSFDLAITLRYGVSLQAGDRKNMINPSINNYCDSEGRWFWLVGLEGERHWPPLVRVVERPEWLEDSRFATPEARAANASELIAALDEIFL